MSTFKRMLQSSYLPLVISFVQKNLSARDFADRFIDLRQNDEFISEYPEPIYNILESIFLDSIEYEETPDAEYFEISEVEFLSRCSKNLEILKNLL